MRDQAPEKLPTSDQAQDHTRQTINISLKSSWSLDEARHVSSLHVSLMDVNITITGYPDVKSTTKKAALGWMGHSLYSLDTRNYTHNS